MPDDGITVTHIEEQLDALRPFIREHGGDVRYVSHQDGVVALRFVGACISCPFSAMTLKMGIEDRLKVAIPQIKSVILVS